MKRIIRDRKLTPEEAAKYNKIREQVAQDLPDLLAKHASRMDGGKTTPPPPPRKQCDKCPWKISTDPRKIPNGYCENRHAGLKGTIATPGQFRLGGLRAMACHESPVGEELPCVGWLHNQMGVGNNIPLRLAAAKKIIDANVEIVGEQHSCFEDTLPKSRPE